VCPVLIVIECAQSQSNGEGRTRYKGRIKERTTCHREVHPGVLKEPLLYAKEARVSKPNAIIPSLPSATQPFSNNDCPAKATRRGN